MKDVVGRLLFVILLGTLTVPVWAAEETVAKSEYSAVFDSRKYYRMRDTKAAAKQLVEHATYLGWDIEAVGDPGDRFALYFMCGSVKIVDPDPADRSFVNQMASASSRGSAGAVTFLLQTNRRLSIIELASILDSGVRILKTHPPWALIAHAPASKIAELSQLEFVRWMGPYAATYKCRPENIRPEKEAMIKSLDGDRLEFRADLERLGLSVSSYPVGLEAFYAVKTGPKQALRIAELWWVEWICQEEGI